MKTTSREYAESPRLALWSGLAIALGIVLHRVFFLFALMIALSRPIAWLINWGSETEAHSIPTRGLT